MKAKVMFGLLGLGFVGPAFADVQKAEPGWMGARLGPVPEALGVHLGIDRDALMVLNVVAGSPGDLADLHRYDVIVAFNGQPVPGDFREFADTVREAGAKAEVELKIYREGKSKTVKMVLDERPRHRLEYKYVEEPDEIYRDHFDVVGKVLKRTPEGGWAIEDLWGPGQLPKALEEYMKNVTPGLSDVERWVWRGGQRWRSRVRELENGTGIEIEKREDGTVIVRRFTREGDVEKVKKEVYGDEKQLKDKDPQAYDLYRDMKSGRPVRNPHRLYGGKPFDREKWVEEFNARLQRALGDGMPGPKRRPFTSFSVDEQGKIEVTIRGQGGDVKEAYKDEADLQMRDPDLYKRLLAIKKSGEKKEEPAVADKKQ